MHTEGKLTVSENLPNCILHKSRVVASANTPEDARRLVSCWNAFAGIKTHVLDEIAARGVDLSNFNALEQERDELVATLRFIAEDIAQTDQLEGETIDTVKELLAKYPEQP
jgi:hypothetical protein